MKYICFTTIFFIIFTLYFLFVDYKKGKVQKDTFTKLVWSYVVCIVLMIVLLKTNW